MSREHHCQLTLFSDLTSVMYSLVHRCVSVCVPHTYTFLVATYVHLDALFGCLMHIILVCPLYVVSYSSLCMSCCSWSVLPSSWMFLWVGQGTRYIAKFTWFMIVLYYCACVVPLNNDSTNRGLYIYTLDTQHLSVHTCVWEYLNDLLLG